MHAMQKSSDILIIGAGIIGLNVAWQLVRRGCTSITVLEKGSGLGEGSSGASSAVCRHLYTHAPVIELARDGINAYRDWQTYLQAPQAPLAEFQQTGVLWLGSHDKVWADSDRASLSSLQIPSEILDSEALAARFPGINPCPLAPDLRTATEHTCLPGTRHLFEPSGGYMDPQNALQDLQAALARQGVKIAFNERAADLIVQNDCVTGARTAQGNSYSADVVVSAGGPWCNALLAPLGLDTYWPLVPTRIQIAHLQNPGPVAHELPVCVDLASGIYFRPQNRGQQIIVGSTLEEDEQEQVDPSAFLTVPDDVFIAAKVHALQHRLPSVQIEQRPVGYCGLYTVNRSDMHPIVGPSPVPGLFVANGFSGHGFKLAPAIGSLAAQQLTDTTLNDDTRADPSFLAWERAPIALQTKNVLA